MNRILWAGRLAVFLVCLLVAGMAWGATINTRYVNPASTAEGTSNFTVTVTDAAEATDDQALSITINTAGSVIYSSAFSGGMQISGGVSWQ